MSGPSEDEDKQHDATSKKLEDARKKGEIPRSADLNTAASYAGLALVGVSLGGAALSQVGDVGVRLVHHADSLSHDLFHGGLSPQFAALMLASIIAVAPLFAGPAVFSLLSVLAQRSFVVAPTKIQPKVSRISPISNAKNKFGRAGLFEFAKSTAKLLIFSSLLTLFLYRNLPDVLATMHLDPAMAMAQMLNMSVEFLLFVVVIAVIMGAGDFLWQRGEHLRKNRMSHQELKDEVKQSEGDPYVKQQRRQKGMAIAMNQMLADVPSADVIIVNPTHFAVALKWDRTTPGAPVCVAKGVDEIAARIREFAAEAGVPIHSDPPTARALHATVEIGQEISKEHYGPVAAAIRFSEAMRAKARAF